MVNVRLITDIPKLLDSGGVTGQYLYKATSTAIGFDSINYSDIIGYPSTPADSDFVKSIINTDILSPLVDSAVYSTSTYLNSGIGSNILKESSGVTVKLGNYSKGISNLYLDSSSTITIGSHSFSLANNGEISFFGGSASSYGVSSGSSPAVVVENSNYTSFLLKTDSTQTDAQVDASTNTFTITESGDVKSTAFSPYHPKGYQIDFDGTGDYLKTPALGTFPGEFTFEFWFKSNSASAAIYLLDQGIQDTNLSISTDYLNTDVTYVKIAGTSLSYSSCGYNGTDWNHVVLVRDSSNNVGFFVNGSRIGVNNTVTGTVASNPYYIGSSSAGTGASGYTLLNGSLSHFRISDTERYTATSSSLSVPTQNFDNDSNTKVLLAQGQFPFIDGSSNDHTITLYGNLETSINQHHDHVAYSPSSHGGSVYFDGTGDYLTVSSNIHDNIGTGDFTAEAWVYLDEAIGSNRGIFGSGSSDGDDQFTLLLLSSGVLYFDYGGSQDYVQTGVVFTANVWHHIALTRSGTSFNIWLNGTSVGSATLSADIGGASNFTVGSGRGIVWKGYITDARVVTGTAVYTSAFTPPAAPLTAIAGTQLLTCTNKNNIYDAAGGNLLTVVGDTTTNTSTVNYSSSSIYFDGGGDYIKLNGSFSDFFDGPFTIEFFVNLTNATSSSVISLGDGSGVDGMYLLHGGYGCYLGTNGSWNLISGSVTGMTTGTWHHFALTWDGSDYRIFVDGALELSATSSTKLGPGGGYTLAIGATYTGAQPTTGYVEDVRFTKGLARYTSAFTPPTAALEA